MKPIRIEIENLRSFRERRIISFDELELFAILGDTGAGKTSILEAITYALFNRSTWDGSKVKELIAKGTSAMSVIFVFSVDGIEYTVSRITKERGQPVHRLQCPARGIDLTAERQITAAIEQTLHLNAEAFLHTVLMPQGKHDELLTKDNAKRNKILSELFRLEDLAKVSELVKLQESRADLGLRAKLADRTRLPSDPNARVATAQTDVLAATEAVAKATAAAKRTKMLDTAIAEKTASLGRIATRMAAVTIPADTEPVLRAVAETDGLLRERQIEQNAAKERASEAKASAEAILSRLTNEHLDRSSLGRYERSLDTIEAAVREIQREQNDRERRETLLTQITTTITALDEDVNEAERHLAATRSAVADAVAESERLRVKKDTLAALIANHAAAIAEKDVRAEDLRNKQNVLAGADARLLDADAAVAQAAAEEAHATRARETAEVAAGAAALAAHLHAGEACPICTRLLPDSFVAPDSPDLERTKRAEAAARQNLTTATNTKTRLEATIKTQRETEAEAQGHLERANAQLIAAQDTIVAALDHSDDDPTVVLQKLTNALEQITKDLPSLRKASDDAQERAASAKTKLATTRQEANGHQEAVGALAASLAQRREQMTAQITTLPEAFSPSADLSKLIHAREAIQNAVKSAIAAEHDVKTASETLAKATTALAQIERDRSTTVVGPRSRLYERLNAVARVLTASEIPEDEADQITWAYDVIAKAAVESKRLDALAQGESASRAAYTEEREKIVRELDAEPQDAVTRNAIALQTAEAALSLAQADLERVQHIAESIAKLEPVKVGLTTLKEKLNARNFPAYATELRQQRLLQSASQILTDMTRGRYEFGEEFTIRDHDTNESRQPQTLSGGEKFLASLALSLAVVEIAANGGAKIESLFLDEGFASLDSDTLEMAMLELKKRSRKGRLICVISHLSQVTEFVSNTFIVSPGEHGTQIKKIEGPIDEDQSVAEGLVTALRA